MTTYWSLYQSAAADVGIFYPNLRITSRQGLRWMTEAVHHYQSETNLVRCHAEFDLSTANTTGVYPLPKCPQVFYLVEYQATDINAPVSFPRMIDWEDFERTRNGWKIDAQQVSVVSSQPLICTFLENNFHLFPFAGIEGTIRLDYKPALTPYDADDKSGDWAAWNPDPETKMRQNTYPKEFAPAEMGIKAYLKAMMMTAIPNYRQVFPGYYEEQMNLFYSSVEKILRGNPPQDKNINVLHWMGPVM